MNFRFVFGVEKPFVYFFVADVRSDHPQDVQILLLVGPGRYHEDRFHFLVLIEVVLKFLFQSCKHNDNMIACTAQPSVRNGKAVADRYRRSLFPLIETRQKLLSILHNFRFHCKGDSITYVTQKPNVIATKSQRKTPFLINGLNRIKLSLKVLAPCANGISQRDRFANVGSGKAIKVCVASINEFRCKILLRSEGHCGGVKH